MKSVYYLNFVPLSDECAICLKFKATDYLSVSLDKVVGTEFERVATCDYSFKELKNEK